MFASKEQIKNHYRKVLLTNDTQLLCCNPEYPKQEVPEEISIHSLSTLQPLKHYIIQPGDRILDIGCGAGADCFLAIYRGGPSVEISGIDFVGELIARAKELQRRYKIQNIEFSHSDVPPLLFGDNTFDLVIMNYSFHLFEDKLSLLEEITRVLSENGKVIIADSFTPKALKSAGDEENWLLAAGGAITVDEFGVIAKKVDLIIEKFVPEQLPGLPEGVSIGNMICHKA